MPGPKPKPTAFKILHGNPGKRPLPANEPQPELSTPDCPEHLDSQARMEWERIVPELEKLGLNAQVYRAPLAAYCQCYSRWQAAEELIASEGLTIQIKDTIRVNPAVTVAKDAMRMVREFSAEFGITPASKTRIKVDPKEKKSISTRQRA